MSPGAIRWSKAGSLAVLRPRAGGSGAAAWGGLAALRTSRTPCGLCPCGRRGSRVGLARSRCGVPADALLEAPRTRPPLRAADPGEREDGQAGHRLAVPAGEAPLEALGGRAGCRDEDCITSDAGGLRRTGPRVPKAPPQQPRPRQDGGAQALDGAIAAAFPRPPGAAQHGQASRYPQPGQDAPTPSAVGRRCDRGAEAWEKCDNVHHGLLRRVRVVVVVDNTSTRDLRQKPYQVANFGEGIVKCIKNSK